MNTLYLKIVLLFIVGLCIVPFISSGTPNYLYKDQVAIIMYHHLSDTAKSSVTITPKLFRDQLEFLKNNNYNFITFQQFEHYMKGGAVPDNAILVAFDDGYESFYQYGYPILKELGIPAVHFIITGTIDHPNSGNISFMGTEHLKEIAQDQNAHIDLECHSDNLHSQKDGRPLLTSWLLIDGRLETEQEYTDRITKDTSACISKLKDMKGSASSDAYAYPFGVYDQNSSALLASSGIKYAFTVVSEMATRDDDPLQLPRITGGNPSITPEDLQKTIIRKIVDLKQTFEYVPFRKSIGQIGGTMIQDKDGTINFFYHGNHWETHLNSSTVTLEGKTMGLSQPIKLSGRKAQIQYNDLQRVMGIRIAYNPVTETFSERHTPSKITATNN